MVPFRSPLLRESQLFSLPTGTEMFHFPALPSTALFHSDGDDTPQRVPGYPIRKPPDQRSVANSPGHIAGSHVLHRLLVPRHPPNALKNLTNTTNHNHPPNQQPPTQKEPVINQFSAWLQRSNENLQKMLASTIQFPNHKPTHPTTTHQTTTRKQMVWYEQPKERTSHKKTPHPPASQKREDRKGLWLFSQNSTVCPPHPPPARRQETAA
jgi:hypothetical protein